MTAVAFHKLRNAAHVALYAAAECAQFAATDQARVSRVSVALFSLSTALKPSRGSPGGHTVLVRGPPLFARLLESHFEVRGVLPTCWANPAGFGETSAGQVRAAPRKALQTLQGTSFKQELRRNPEAACKRRKRRFPHRGALINPPFLTHSFPDFPHPPLSGCDRLQGPCSVSHYPAAPCLMSLALFAQRRALSATNRDDGRLDAVFA